jgi:hypothetical protein
MNKILVSFLFCFQFTVYLFAQHSALSDEFNAPCDLYKWQNIDSVEGWYADHLEQHNVSVAYEGELMMMPYTSSWFEDYRGVLLFKELEGDFVFTSRITVTNRAGLAVLPNTVFSLAGLMVRAPKTLTNGATGWQPDEENYVFLSIGRASGNTQFQFEVKTTQDGNSVLNISNIGVNQIYIRMIRINNAILALYSLDNINWAVHRRYDRSDLPNLVQLGFVTYTDWPNVNSYVPIVQNSNILNDDFDANVNWSPDLIGRFGFARFENVTIPTALQGLDFYIEDTNNNGVSDSQILSFLNYPSESIVNTTAKIWKGINDSDWNNSVNWNGGILPVQGDEIIIPNCSCPEVFNPVIPLNTPVYSSLFLEPGAQLNVPIGHTLNIDLQNAQSHFIIEGRLENNGNINIINSDSKPVIIRENLINYPSAEINIEE